MARIPAHTLTQPKSSGVEVPQGAFSATIRGAVDVIEAAGGVADEYIKIGREAQAILNDRKVRAKSREMREMQARFLEEIQTADVNGNKPDPEDYGTMWQKRLSEFKNSMGGKGVPPVVMDAVKTQFEDFAGKSLLGITALAFKENRKRAFEDAALDYDEKVAVGDWDGAKEDLDDMLATGKIDERQHRRMKLSHNERKKKHDVTVDILTDPTAAVEKMKAGTGIYKDMPEDERLTTIKAGELQIGRVEAKELGKINELIELKLINSRDELKAQLENTPGISVKTREKALRQWDIASPLSAKERNMWRDRINNEYFEFMQGKISFEEYNQKYTDTAIELGSLGKRGGSGEFRSLHYQINPSAAQSKSVKEYAELTKELFKRPSEISYREIKRRVESATKIQVAEKFDPDADKIDQVAKEKFLAGKARFNEVFRETLEQNMNAWMATLPTPPEAAEVFKYMDSIQANTMKEAQNKISSARILKAERAKRNDVLNQDQQRLQQWHDDSGQGTTTPPLPFEQHPLLPDMNILR